MSEFLGEAIRRYMDEQMWLRWDRRKREVVAGTQPCVLRPRRCTARSADDPSVAPPDVSDETPMRVLMLSEESML